MASGAFVSFLMCVLSNLEDAVSAMQKDEQKSIATIEKPSSFVKIYPSV